MANDQPMARDRARQAGVEEACRSAPHLLGLTREIRARNLELEGVGLGGKMLHTDCVAGLQFAGFWTGKVADMFLGLVSVGRPPARRGYTYLISLKDSQLRPVVRSR